ncbi:MAG TPA: MBL fold metallo-hydrolase [Firmicutes bacterium]|nr:MBL fold metallo-hydrolase [Bacillota bacterium]
MRPKEPKVGVLARARSLLGLHPVTRLRRAGRGSRGLVRCTLVVLALTVLAVEVPSLQARAAGIAGGPARLRVHFIDVGQGDAVLVEAPSGKTMLIDGGPPESSDRLVEYLKVHGVSKLDVVVSTHPHADHIGGLIEVLREFKVGLVVDSGKVHTTATYERFLSLIDEKGIDFRLGRAGGDIDLGPGVEARILSPVEPLPENINDCSVVIRLRYGTTSFLFTGDAERDAEDAMLRRGVELGATVLKVAHHGSSTSSKPWFLEEVKPAVAVILVGAGNPFGHPHRVTLMNLAEHTDEIYRTDTHGDVLVVTDGTTFQVSTAR